MTTETAPVNDPIADVPFPWDGKPSRVSIARFSVDVDAAVEIFLARYEDHAPIRTIEIIDPCGAYVSISLGYTIEHEIAIADRLIAVLTELRNGAAEDLANPQNALKPMAAAES